MSKNPPMPYVKEYEDGTLVGALTKAHADRLIADLIERSPGHVKKAAKFQPANPGTRAVLTGQLPGYPTRTADAKASEAFYAAVELVRRAFVQAEGRQPTAEDANFNTAVEQLYERYFPKSRPAPVRKTSGGSGLVSSAIHKSMTAPSPNGRVVMTDRSGGNG